jgi:hypothetical protein
MEAVMEMADRFSLGVWLRGFWHAFCEGVAEIVNRPTGVALALIATAVFLGCTIAVVAVFGIGGAKP